MMMFLFLLCTNVVVAGRLLEENIGDLGDGSLLGGYSSLVVQN